MRRAPRAIVLLALLLPLQALLAAALTTLELHNRPAEELLPIVRPLLGPDEAVSGQGFTLFLRASPATTAQVRQVIDSLDVAPRMLLISVFQGSDRELRALDLGASARLQQGDTAISIGNDARGGRGADIRIESGGDSARAHGHSTRARLRESPIHSLRVSAGSEGFIETGREIPFFSGPQWIGPRGTVSGSVDYRPVTTGFYVLPRVHGEQVHLEVSPFKRSLGARRGGEIDTQRASTTVSGRLGQWLQIGGVSSQSQRTQSGVGRYSSTRTRHEASIWIKAEPVN